MPVLTTERQTFLEQMRNAIIATNRPGHAPQVSPVWFLWTEDRIVISTDVTTAKVANIRRDPRVTVCIDDPDTGRYAAATGRAEIVEGPPVMGPTLDLIRKYRPESEVVPHWERISAIAPRVLILVEPQHWYWRWP